MGDKARADDDRNDNPSRGVISYLLPGITNNNGKLQIGWQGWSERDDSIAATPLVLYPSELTEAEEKNRHVIHYFIHLWTRTNGPSGRHCTFSTCLC